MEKLLTISQVSRLSGRTRNTIQAWTRNGRISSSNDGIRTLISLSEFLRVFPEVEPVDIEQELSIPVSQPQAEKNQTAESNSSTFAHVSEDSALRHENELLRLENEMLKKQIGMLERERENMLTMLNREAERVEQFVGRLIPAQSSARRGSGSCNQPRTSNGRFAPKGEGVAALIPDATEEDDKLQQGSLL